MLLYVCNVHELEDSFLTAFLIESCWVIVHGLTSGKRGALRQLNFLETRSHSKFLFLQEFPKIQKFGAYVKKIQYKKMGEYIVVGHYLPESGKGDEVRDSHDH